MANNRLDSLKKSIAVDRERIKAISQKKFNDENFDMLASARKLKFMYQQFETIRRSEDFTPAVDVVLAEVSDAYRLLDFDDLDIGQVDAFIEALQATKVMAKAAIGNKGTRAKIEKIVNEMQNEAASISAGTIFKERITMAAKGFVSKMFDFTGIVSWVSRGNPLLTSVARMAQESYMTQAQRKRVSASSQAQANIRMLNARKQLKQKLVSRGGVSGSKGSIRIGGLSNQAGFGGASLGSSPRSLVDNFNTMSGGDDEGIGSGGILSRILDEHVQTNRKLDAILTGMKISDDRAAEDAIEADQRAKKFLRVTEGQAGIGPGGSESGDGGILDEMLGGLAAGQAGSLLGRRRGSFSRGAKGVGKFALKRLLPAWLLFKGIMGGMEAKGGSGTDITAGAVGSGVEGFYQAFGWLIGMKDEDIKAMGEGASKFVKDNLGSLIEGVGNLFGGLSKLIGGASKDISEYLESKGGMYNYLKGGVTGFLEHANKHILREPDFSGFGPSKLGDLTRSWEGGRNAAHIQNEADGTRSFGSYGMNEKSWLPKFLAFAKSRGVDIDMTGSLAHQNTQFRTKASAALQEEFYQTQMAPSYRENAIGAIGEYSRSRLTGDRGLGDYIDDMYNVMGEGKASTILKMAFDGVDITKISEDEAIRRLRDARIKMAPSNFKTLHGMDHSAGYNGVLNRITQGAIQAMRIDRSPGNSIGLAEMYTPGGSPAGPIKASPAPSMTVAPMMGAQNSAPPTPAMIPIIGGADNSSFWRATFENYVPHTVR